MKLIIFACIAATAIAATPTTQAQQGRTQIRRVDTDGFNIRFYGEVGVTREFAGLSVMDTGCRLARENNFTHFSVSYFGTIQHPSRVLVSRGRMDGLIVNGRATSSQVSPDVYRTDYSGEASLVMVMMNQGGVDMLAPLYDIVNASSCTVVSSAPR